MKESVVTAQFILRYILCLTGPLFVCLFVCFVWSLQISYSYFKILLMCGTVFYSICKTREALYVYTYCISMMLLVFMSYL